MINLIKQGNSLVITSSQDFPFEAGKIVVPQNALTYAIDESDIVCFRSVSNYDILFTGLLKDITINGTQATKDNLIQLFDAVGNAPTGGVSDDVYTKEEIDNKHFLTKIVLTQAEYDNLPTKDPDVIYVISDAPETQEKLVNQVNIKSINNESILGEGNIEITVPEITVDNTLSETSENPVQNKILTTELNKKTESRKLTQEEYNQLTPEEKELNILYIITDAPEAATQAWTNEQLTAKQDTLVSGANIKTINNQDIIGSGNIEIKSNEYNIDQTKTNYTVGASRTVGDKVYLADPATDKNYTHTFGFDKIINATGTRFGFEADEFHSSYGEQAPSAVYQGTLIHTIGGDYKAVSDGNKHTPSYRINLKKCKENDIVFLFSGQDMDHINHKLKVIYHNDGLYLEYNGLKPGDIEFYLENKNVYTYAMASGSKIFSFTEQPADKDFNAIFFYKASEGIYDIHFTSAPVFYAEGTFETNSDEVINEASTYLRYSNNKKSYLLTKDNFKKETSAITELALWLPNITIEASEYNEPKIHWYPMALTEKMKAWNVNVITKFLAAPKEYNIIASLNDSLTYDENKGVPNTIYPLTWDGAYFSFASSDKYNINKKSLMYKVLFKIDPNTGDLGENELEIITDVFDATPLFTASQNPSDKTVTEDFQTAILSAISEKKVMVIHQTDVNVVITFAQKKDSIVMFTATNNMTNYFIQLNTATREVSIEQKAVGSGTFDKYSNEQNHAIFDLTTDSTNNDIQVAFSTDVNGVKIPDVGDVVEVKDIDENITDSAIVISHIQTADNIDLIFMKNNIVDDFIVYFNLKINYNAATGFDSLRVLRSTSYEVNPALITDTEMQALKGQLQNAGKVVELSQSEYDQLGVKDPKTLYVISDAPEINVNDFATNASVDEKINAAIAGVEAKITEINNKI